MLINHVFGGDGDYVLASRTWNRMNAANKLFILSSLFIPLFVTLQQSGFHVLLLFCFSPHIGIVSFSSTLKMHLILFATSHLVAIVLNPGTLTGKPPEMCFVCAPFKLSQTPISDFVIITY